MAARRPLGRRALTQQPLLTRSLHCFCRCGRLPCTAPCLRQCFNACPATAPPSSPSDTALGCALPALHPSCGSMSHKTKDCMERPRTKGARWTNKNIAADEKVRSPGEGDPCGSRAQRQIACSLPAQAAHVPAARSVLRRGREPRGTCSCSLQAEPVVSGCMACCRAPPHGPFSPARPRPFPRLLPASSWSSWQCPVPLAAAGGGLPAAHL